MKKLTAPIIVFAAALCAALLLLAGGFRFGRERILAFEEKQAQIRTRLLEAPVLLYHNIDGTGDFSVSLETLRSHFLFIRQQNIRVVSLKEMVSALETARPFKEPVIAITFDDGYPAMYTKLLPLLREFGYPATLFIYTDAVNGGKRLLNWEALREMDGDLIDVQCHGLSHRDLTKLSDAAGRKRLFEELYMSKRLIELNLGKKVDFFAFPYGRYSERLTELCRAAGYRKVFSTDYGNNILSADNFCLKRQHIKKSCSEELFRDIVLNVR